MRIGIDLGGTKTELAVLDKDNQVLWRQRLPSARLPSDVPLDIALENTYQQTIAVIVELLHAVEKEIPSLKGLPVGMGTPGSENSKGLLRNCNSIWLNGKNLRVDLENRLQRPVCLANDANCFTLAEARMGAAKGANSVFGVILGTGVGGGLVLKGDLQVGVNHIAGEWGHNQLSVPLTEQRSCYCGRVNCVETWLSGTGLSLSYQRACGQHHSVIDIIRRAETGDLTAQNVWGEYCQALAQALAQIINVVDPEIIVLGGGVSNVLDLYQQIPALWGAHIFSDEISTRLVRAELGDSSGVFGAAWLW